MRTLAVPVWGQGPCEGLQLCGYVLIQVIARQLSQIIVCVCSVVSSSFRQHGQQPARLLLPFPGKKLVEQVAISASTGSSQPRDRIHVSWTKLVTLET